MTAQGAGLDFIVIGAQKAGTTSLFQYLRNHPQVWLPEQKELPYFSDDGLFGLGWAAYVQRLDPAEAVQPPEVRRGTVTPQYMAGSVFSAAAEDAESRYDERTVPSRIREQLGDVRLVAILRDPVERAISHHRMEVRRGREERSFDDAVQELLEPAAAAHARRFPKERTGYVAWGEYGRILSGYFDVFAPPQILVVFTDQLESSPADVLSRIHRFIGVSADFVPENLGVRYGINSAAGRFSWRRPASWLSPSSPLSPQGVQRRLWRSRLARRAWGGLSEERRRQVNRGFGRIVRAAGRRQTAARLNQRAEPEGRTGPEPSEATLARLAEHYAADGAVLASLLGAAPPWQVQAVR